jgi:hypothetical protein
LLGLRGSFLSFLLLNTALNFCQFLSCAASLLLLALLLLLAALLGFLTGLLRHNILHLLHFFGSLSKRFRTTLLFLLSGTSLSLLALASILILLTTPLVLRSASRLPF